MHTVTYFQAQNMLLVYGGKAQPDFEEIERQKAIKENQKRVIGKQKERKRRQRKNSYDSFMNTS